MQCFQQMIGNVAPEELLPVMQQRKTQTFHQKNGGEAFPRNQWNYPKAFFSATLPVRCNYEIRKQYILPSANLKGKQMAIRGLCKA